MKMEISDFETVDSLPCLYHPELDLIVLSDLHLGLEGSMTSEGSYIPKFQLNDVLQDIENAQEETGATRILVNGDLKNEFRKSYYSEKKEVGKFISEMKTLFDEVILVKGNHDTFIEETVEEYGLELQENFSENGILFTHGHKDVDDVSDFGKIVIGHEHPALSLKDEIGVVEKVDCIIYGETDSGTDLIVLPAFSSISNGTRINETPQSQLLSPVLKNHIDVKKMKAVAVSREAGLFDFPEIGKI